MGYNHENLYYEQNGHLNVPNYYVCNDGFNLYSWVNNNVYKYRSPGKKGMLTPEQLRLLDGIGFKDKAAKPSMERINL